MSDLQAKTAALAAGALALLLAGAARGADVPKGQQIFLDQKCNKCHAVESLKIAVLAPEEDDEEEAPPEPGEEEVKPPDLSNAGSDFAKAAEIEKWLTKKLEREGKLHRHKFRGSAEDLGTLSQWLMTLKTPPKK